jgi:hypothetical protein
MVRRCPSLTTWARTVAGRTPQMSQVPFDMLILAEREHQGWQEHNRVQNRWFRVPHKKLVRRA